MLGHFVPHQVHERGYEINVTHRVIKDTAIHPGGVYDERLRSVTRVTMESSKKPLPLT